jgi:DNA-directed RNA polymerase specialized sigma24 family protein
VVGAWARFDPERARPRTWILAIARNVLTDHFRRQAHRNAISLDEHPGLAASLVSSDDPAARYVSADTVREWLRGLEPRERELHREVGRAPELDVAARAVAHRDDATARDLVAPQLALET